MGLIVRKPIHRSEGKENEQMQDIFERMRNIIAEQFAVDAGEITEA